VQSALWRWCWGRALQCGLQSRVSSTGTAGLAWDGGYSSQPERTLTADPVSLLPLVCHALAVMWSTLLAGCSGNQSLCLKEVNKQLMVINLVPVTSFCLECPARKIRFLQGTAPGRCQARV